MARRVVVLDSGSTDATRQIAERFPAVEWVERGFTSFADQRNHALEHLFPRGEWVLHLDADERSTLELIAELSSLTPPADVVAYNIASRTLLGGRPVLRASAFPVFQTRLTRAGAFRFVEVGHGQKASPELGPLPVLASPYDHLPFEKGEVEWLERHRGYARREAAEIRDHGRRYRLSQALGDPIARRQWMKERTARWPSRPLLVWAYLMCVRRGLLDGPSGWTYCRLRYRYERMVLEELRR